jgi:hypothetical protein
MGEMRMTALQKLNEKKAYNGYVTSGLTSHSECNIKNV